MACPYAPTCINAGAGPASMPTSIAEIQAAKKFYEDMEKEFKEKQNKHNSKKMSLLQIWLLLAILAIPTFVFNSVLLLFGLKMIVTLAKGIGG